jgi:hypothetical protein
VEEVNFSSTDVLAVLLVMILTPQLLDVQQDALFLVTQIEEN